MSFKLPNLAKADKSVDVRENDKDVLQSKWFEPRSINSSYCVIVRVGSNRHQVPVRCVSFSRSEMSNKVNVVGVLFFF